MLLLLIWVYSSYVLCQTEFVRGRITENWNMLIPNIVCKAINNVRCPCPLIVRTSV